MTVQVDPEHGTESGSAPAPAEPPRPRTEAGNSSTPQDGPGAVGRPEPQADQALPGEGSPEGERLREAHQAFDAGDYRRVRQLCDGLAGGPEEVARSAAELRRRTGIDPVQIAVLAGCLLIFLVTVYLYAL